jgi:hypothetical protein
LFGPFRKEEDLPAPERRKQYEGVTGTEDMVLRPVAAVYQDDLFHFRWDLEPFQFGSHRRPFLNVLGQNVKLLAG